MKETLVVQNPVAIVLRSMYGRQNALPESALKLIISLLHGNNLSSAVQIRSKQIHRSGCALKVLSANFQLLCVLLLEYEVRYWLVRSTRGRFSNRWHRHETVHYRKWPDQQCSSHSNRSETINVLSMGMALVYLRRLREV